MGVRISPGASGPCDGIGRRADFKCPCPQGRAGSNPARVIKNIDRLNWDDWKREVAVVGSLPTTVRRFDPCSASWMLQFPMVIGA